LSENVAEMGKIIIVIYVETVLSQRINKNRRAFDERGGSFSEEKIRLSWFYSRAPL
jgi:hypothetical protein